MFSFTSLLCRLIQASINNEVLKFIKYIDFENSYAVICFPYIRLIIDGME